MSDLTHLISNSVVQHFFRATNVAGHTEFHVALASAVTNGENGEFTELAATGGYARKQINFAAPTNGVANLAANADFGIASANYGANISHFFVMNASSSGVALAWKALTTPVQILTGDQFILNTATQLNVS